MSSQMIQSLRGLVAALIERTRARKVIWKYRPPSLVHGGGGRYTLSRPSSTIVVEHSGLPVALSIKVLDGDAQEVASYEVGGSIIVHDPERQRSPELDAELKELWRLIDRQEAAVAEFIDSVRRDINDI